MKKVKIKINSGFDRDRVVESLEEAGVDIKVKEENPLNSGKAYDNDYYIVLRVEESCVEDTLKEGPSDGS